MIKYIFLIAILLSNSLNARTWIQFVNQPIVGRQAQNICYIDLENNYVSRYSLRHGVNPGIIRIEPHVTFQTLNIINPLGVGNMNVLASLEKVAARNFDIQQILARVNHCIAQSQAPAAQNRHNTANFNNHCVCYQLLYNFM